MSRAQDQQDLMHAFGVIAGWNAAMSGNHDYLKQTQERLAGLQEKLRASRATSKTQ